METNQTKEYVFSILTENHPGILHRIASVFLRRKVNIETLNVTASAQEGFSRFIIVVLIEDAVAQTITRQIQKIVGVVCVNSNN